MRIILVTGKGGVGKTSVAAATAVAAAGRGLRTLVTSTDPAHSLEDSFESPIGSDAVLLSERLWAQQMDTQQRLEENWREIRDYAVELLTWTGMSGLRAEEMSVVPGLDELFALADIRRINDSGDYDLLVVDCAPTGETLRLLSLPEILAWYIERIFPIERKIVRTVRPVLQRVRGLPPIADDGVYAAVERFHANIEGIKQILTDPAQTSIRLVLNAEKMVIAEARRTFTYLHLFGYRVDSVIVNRLIPEEVKDPYFKEWRRVQDEHLASIMQSFDPLPVLRARLFETEMVGAELLGALALEVYGDIDPSAVLSTSEPFQVTTTEDEGHRLRIRLPFATNGDVDLARRGDELLIKVGGMRRNVALPQALRRGRVTRAALEGDWLELDFAGATTGA